MGSLVRRATGAVAILCFLSLVWSAPAYSQALDPIGCQASAGAVVLKVKGPAVGAVPQVELRQKGKRLSPLPVGANGCVILPRDNWVDGARLLVSMPGYLPREIAVDSLLPMTKVHEITLAPRLTLPPTDLPDITSIGRRDRPAVPATVTIINGNRLNASLPGQELPVLLGALPGVVAHSDAGFGTGYAYFRVRGMDQTRVNVALDGVSMAEPEDQAFYSMNLVGLAGGVASAQLQRGVGTSGVGTASYAGTLSLETPGLRDMRPEANLTWRTGSFGLQQAVLRWTGVQARDAGWRGSIGITGQLADGFRRESGNRSGGIMATGGHIGNRIEVKGLLLAGEQRNDLAYLPADETTLSRDIRANPLTPEENDRFQQRHVAFTVASVPTDRSRWSATVYGGDLDGRYDLRADSVSLLTFGLASERFGALASYTTSGGPWSLTVGANLDLYYREHSMRVRPDDGGPGSAPLYRNRGDKDEASAFSKLRFRWGTVSVTGEASLRTTEFRYTPDAEAGIAPLDRRWTFLDPKIGLLWSLGRDRHAYVSLGETRREPTRSDLFAGFDNVDSTNIDFIGPLNRVRHERVRDLEVGFRQVSNTSTWGATLFWMSFHNEIAPIGQLSVLGLPLRKNVESSRRIGAEFEGGWQSAATPRPGHPVLHADGTLSILRSRIAVFTDDASGETHRGTPTAGSPPVISTQSINLRWVSGLSLGARGRYLAPAGLDNTGRRALRTPGSYALHLTGGWDLGTWAVDAMIGNILNSRIFPAGITDGETRFLYPEAMRHLVLSLRRDLGRAAIPR